MYEYRYVNLLSEGVFKSLFEEHRAVIDKYAAQGWRYAGYLPTLTSSEGTPVNIDLIFEREKQDGEER